MAWLLVLLAAWAAPAVVVVAEVDADLRGVRGTLTVQDAPDWHWVDPLAELPGTPHELDQLRTFPGSPNVGVVTWTRVDAATLRFETTLPRRYGDVGSSGHGLFANGAWYPQPLHEGRLPIVTWEVSVTLPPGAVGVLGDQAGRTTLHWRGEGERASLAVLPRGEITPVRAPGWSLTLVTPRRPRRAVLRTLQAQLPLAATEGVVLTGAAVQAPLHRRIARPGVGLTYLSERAWATFPWFRRLHHPTVVRGLLEAFATRADPFERSLQAAAVGAEYLRRLKQRQAVDLLGLTRWIPAVDAALYDQEMAFQAELFRRAHPTDRVRDDLVERFAPHTPGTVVIAQLTDLSAPSTVRRLGELLTLGWSLDEAATRLELDPSWFTPWRGPYPEQDYSLDLEGAEVTITRDAPEEAPPEVAVLRVDGADRVVRFDTGPAEQRITLDTPPRRIRLDPRRSLGQTTRLGEVRPPPLRWTLSGAISGINVSERFATAFLVLTARRADDTHNRTRLWAFTNQRDRLRVRLSHTYFFGPLVRGATRRHAVSGAVEGSWLNPRFATFDGTPLTVGGSLAYEYDNRVYSLFPTRGIEARAVVATGGIPATGQTYTSVSGSFSTLADPHPRHILAVDLSGGVAFTDIPQRRLTFGGAQGVRGVADNVIQTERQVVGRIEYRAVPLREANINLLWLTWVRELQLTAGLDAGAGAIDCDTTQPQGSRCTQVAALSATAGVGVVADNLGLSPAAVHIHVGVPLAWRGFSLPARRWRYQLYLSWAQMF